ncbi:MAG: T9SS type A sorting domain-containing protein, partial [Candidatus Latescibacterota bacterium]
HFTIKTDPDIPDGTEIRNKALIVFDANDPIETVEVVNVIQRVPPDLLVSGSSGESGYPYFVEGEDITVTAMIANPTDAATGAFGVAFYDGDPGAGGMLIDSLRVVGVGANGEIPVQATWLPLRMLDQHRIHVVVDTQNEIAELDETNNTHVLVLDPEPKTYTVDYAADINFVSLPLEPAMPYTARSLAEHLGASMIIRYDTASELFEPFDTTGGVFDAFIPTQNGDGFEILPREGYLAVLDQPKQVTFTGITHLGAVGLSERLNFVSLPLEPAEPYTARSFCAKLDANMVIRYVNSSGTFDAFIPEFHSGDGFEILGARGYLAYANRDTTVEFAGRGWFGQQNAPPGGYEPPAPAGEDDGTPRTPVLGVAGRLYQKVWDKETPISGDLRATITNTRTGVRVPVRIHDDTGEFTGAFVDLTNNEPVHAGDVLELSVFNTSGKPVGDPVEVAVTETDVNRRYVEFNAVVTGMSPHVSRLYQNFPNPFNPQTTIRYQLAKRGAVSIRVYNVAGQLVKTLVNETRNPGFYELIWDGSNDHGSRVASGVYFYRLDTPGYTKSMKMVILK